MEGKVGVNCGGRSGRRRKALDLYGSLSFRQSQLQTLKFPQEGCEPAAALPTYRLACVESG